MSSIKPNNASGTRDFLPNETQKRNYIFNMMRSVFEKYGFQEIHTPAMENLSTLTGKYGDEGDTLLFKILNSGDFLKNIPSDVFTTINSNNILKYISEKGLRYDLTVPLARFVSKHQNEISFPFKRFQIAPVWRADRPQKGRYREFYQCDCDVVGSESLLYEVELIQIYNEVLSKLGISHQILINNRKILQGFIDSLELNSLFDKILIIIDKWDKIGKEKVIIELAQLSIVEAKIHQMISVFEENSLNSIRNVDNELCRKGIVEIDYIFEKIESLSSDINLSFNMKLARGLNYYTGAILEVKATDVNMGSIGGAGRYDNLTETFGLKNMSGVGCSFGAERIYDIMEEKKLFPEYLNKPVTKCLLLNFDENSENYAFSTLQVLRQNEINAEMYPTSTKLQKQMKYADANKFPFVIFTGENEISNGNFSIKNMNSGEQKQLNLQELITLLKE